MTDLLIGILLVTWIMLVIVSLLVYKVIKVFVQESINPTPLTTPEEKARKMMEAQTVAEAPPKKRSIWMRLMELRPISEEKDLEMEHTFDGITELDNPTPKWFMALFYITIVFGIVYMLNYHVFGYGKLQDEEYVAEIEQAEAAKLAMLQKPGNAANKINENNVELITDKAELLAGATLFKNACAACHGEHGEGLVGPNLTDEFWLHGGTVNEVFKTIKYGVPDKGMIAWEKTIKPKQIAQLSSYILSLQGSNPAGAKAPQGVKQ